jgi:cytochrome b6-f complex iron-sulfur subunit
MADKAQARQDNAQDNAAEEDALTRRDFLKWAWGAAGAVALVEGGIVAYQYFSPKTAAGEFGGVFQVGQVEDYAPGTVTPFNAGRFYLVRMADGGFLALYRKCPHLGCSVPWDQGAEQFICPCHASVFERNGDVLNPPAPRPLDRFLVTIENGAISVDTGSVIRRDTPRPDDRVYPQEAPA